MQSANDLKQLLFSINHKSYPAYKSTRGAYQFPRYTLSPSTTSRAIRSPLRRGSAFMSAAKPLHFRLFSTTHMKSASPSRITCCASLRAPSHRIRSAQRVPAKVVCWG